MRKAKSTVTALMAALCMCSTAVPLCPAAAYDACDVNHDGSVDISDVICINQHLSGARAYTNYNQLDANKSHTVDATDANCVMQKAIKGSYSVCYIRQYPNAGQDVVNMPAVSSSITLDSAASSTFGRWYKGYSFLKQAKITNYQLKPTTMILNSTSGAQTYSLVNGDDNRGIAHGYENTGIVLIQAGSGLGTGFVVGDHQIATAGHCVYDNDKNSQTNNIIPSISIETYDRSGMLTGTKLTVAEVHVPVNYTIKSANCDYALITVVEDLSDYVHFDIGNSYNMTNSEAGAIPIHVTGRPGPIGDNESSYNDDNALYTHYGSVYGNDNVELLHYTVDTTRGQSGSPVYAITRETYNNTFYYTYTALAIHVSGADGTHNIGTLMTKHHQMFYNNNPYAHYE